MTDLLTLGKQAKETAYKLGLMDTKTKNELLQCMADELEKIRMTS